jgi:hypothetical protein
MGPTSPGQQDGQTQTAVLRAARGQSATTIAVAVGSYLLVALFVGVMLALNGIELNRIPTVILLAMLVIGAPLLLTVGIFASYRVTYKREASKGKVLGGAIEEVMAWRRYALPISFLLCLMTLSIGILVIEDLAYTSPLRFGPRLFVPGAWSAPLVQVGTSTTVEISSIFLYWAYLGYLVSLLGVMYIRYTSRNLVPAFYLAATIRWVYVTIAVLVVYLAVGTGTGLLGEGASIFSDDRLMVLLAFVVGLSPQDWIERIVKTVRRRFGGTDSDRLPLSLVNGIDDTLQAYLQEANIDSLQTLATQSNTQIYQATKIPRDTIADWQKQAWLLNALGNMKIIERFRRLSINDIEDIEVLKEHIDFSASEKIPAADLAAALAASDTEAANNNTIMAVILRVMQVEYEHYKAKHAGG